MPASNTDWSPVAHGGADAAAGPLGEPAAVKARFEGHAVLDETAAASPDGAGRRFGRRGRPASTDSQDGRDARATLEPSEQLPTPSTLIRGFGLSIRQPRRATRGASASRSR